jgi:hypothetical protein
MARRRSGCAPWHARLPPVAQGQPAGKPRSNRQHGFLVVVIKRIFLSGLCSPALCLSKTRLPTRRCSSARAHAEASLLPPSPPPLRTNRTRRVLHPASFTPDAARARGAPAGCERVLAAVPTAGRGRPRYPRRRRVRRRGAVRAGAARGARGGGGGGAFPQRASPSFGLPLCCRGRNSVPCSPAPHAPLLPQRRIPRFHLCARLASQHLVRAACSDSGPKERGRVRERERPGQ